MHLKKDKTRLKKSLILNLIATITLLGYFLYFVYISYGVKTSGFFKIVNKETEDNKYYILIDNKKLRCNRSEYNLITEGKEYLLSFDWNKLNPQNGKLTYIKSVN
jgi:hypothetical protein